MSVKTHPIRDSATMLRRDLLHIKRYPSMVVLLVGTPVIMLLLFVYVFGGTMGAGLPGGAGGRAQYLDYIVPGILLMTIATVGQGIAISIATDMTEGIVARFRTMSIARGAILTGHVVGGVIRSVAAVGVIIGFAALLGYRPDADGFGWLGFVGMAALIGFALSWLTAALGMACKTVESASNVPMPLMMLPFLGSGFVPADSMPTGLRWFAEYQPFTPMIESLRGLLTGRPDAGATWLAVAWCLGIALVGYLWARRSFERVSDR